MLRPENVFQAVKPLIRDGGSTRWRNTYRMSSTRRGMKGLLEEMLKLARQQRFGKKGQALTDMQRSLFEEDADG